MADQATATEADSRTADPYKWGLTFEWEDYLLASSFVPLIILGTYANAKTVASLFVKRGYVK